MKTFDHEEVFLDINAEYGGVCELECTNLYYIDEYVKEYKEKYPNINYVLLYCLDYFQ